MDNQNKNDNKTQSNDIPLLEWIAASIGAVIVLAVLGALIYEAGQANSTPPVITFEVRYIERLDNGDYSVAFTAHNDGDRTAASVDVEAQLRDGDTVIESSTVTLDYLPPTSHRNGGLYFMHNPADYDLQLRALGYRAP